MKIKIKKNDTVMVITGDDKGKSGRVLDVNAKKKTVLIEGINIHIKHQRPNQRNQQGGRTSMEFPVHYSNVMLLDSDKNPTRVGFAKETKGNRTEVVRIAKTNGKAI